MAYVYDKLNKHRVQGQTSELGEEKLGELLKTANFGKLYAHAALEVTPDSPELRNRTEGSWTKFMQTTDPRSARRLSDSLQAHGTGWCTAGESTAAIQLEGGDFYVYYTRDENGKDTVPRVAIRMQNGQVAEVRGVNTAQEIEPVMADIASEQLQELPGGEEYVQTFADMKRLTELDKRITAYPDTVLTRGEVMFLYELGHTITGFGYDRDPRIDTIRRSRGERDYAELKVLAVERLRESFAASYDGYNAVAEQLGAEIVDHAEMQKLFDAQFLDWKERGVLDYVAERIVKFGELHTLVITPNVLATPAQIQAVARKFSQYQPGETLAYDDLCNQYSAEELSGKLAPDQSVRFSLIPIVRTAELGYQSVEHQLATLNSLQSMNPNLNIHVPSVMDAMVLWQTIIARGEKITGEGSRSKISIRHFNLAPKTFNGQARVPESLVGLQWEIDLVGESLGGILDEEGRVAVG